MRPLVVLVFVLVFLSACTLWGWSLVAPTSVGECTSVPARVGSKPFERDCRPYPAFDFATFVVALGVFAWLLVGSDSGELEWRLPWGGSLKIKREAGQKAADLLRERADAVEDRGEEYLKVVETVIEGARGQQEGP